MPLSGSARAVECILLAVLSADHALLVGPPGTTRSASFFGFLSRFPEARKFQTLATKLGSEDEYFGPVELSALKDDPCERNLDGRLAGIECAFLDEVFKGSDSASAQIKLAEWDAARAGVDRVTLPERIVQELLRIRNELKANGIVVSDRRWIAVTRVLRAATWLDDCAEVELDHLAAHRRRSVRSSSANHMSGLLPAEQDAGSPITGRTVARWMRQATRRAGSPCSRARTPSATRSARTSRCGGRLWYRSRSSPGTATSRRDHGPHAPVAERDRVARRVACRGGPWRQPGTGGSAGRKGQQFRVVTWWVDRDSNPGPTD